MTTSSKGVALVTGASTGIGATYADRLARRGYDLILVARNKDRLEALAQRLTEATGRTVEVVPADLNDKADLGRVEAILAGDPRITLLVNNAGVAVIDPILGSDIDRVEAMIGLNVVAPTRLAFAAAPGFAARGGAIINTASVVSIGPEILGGAYGATKAFGLALSRSLHHELGPKGVRIQAVLPGATATDFWDIPAACWTAALNRHAVDEMVDAVAGLWERNHDPALPDAADRSPMSGPEVLLPNLSRVRRRATGRLARRAVARGRERAVAFPPPAE